MAKKYTGQFLRVKPARPFYAVGERIHLECKVRVTRTATADPFWTSIIDVLGMRTPGVVERLASTNGTVHIATPWVADVETYDTKFDLGQQPAGGLFGRVELRAGGSGMTLVAEKPFRIPLPPSPLLNQNQHHLWVAIAVVIAVVLALFVARKTS